MGAAWMRARSALRAADRAPQAWLPRNADNAPYQLALACKGKRRSGAATQGGRGSIGGGRGGCQGGCRRKRARRQGDHRPRNTRAASGAARGSAPPTAHLSARAACGKQGLQGGTLGCCFQPQPGRAASPAWGRAACAGAAGWAGHLHAAARGRGRPRRAPGPPCGVGLGGGGGRCRGDRAGRRQPLVSSHAGLHLRPPAAPACVLPTGRSAACAPAAAAQCSALRPRVKNRCCSRVRCAAARSVGWQARCHARACAWGGACCAGSRAACTLHALVVIGQVLRGEGGVLRLGLSANGLRRAGRAQIAARRAPRARRAPGRGRRRPKRAAPAARSSGARRRRCPGGATRRRWAPRSWPWCWPAGRPAA